MKKVLFSALLLVVSLFCYTSISNAEDNTAFQICKEKQEACKATCDSSTVRPLKKKRCKNRCDVSYHECRERELHEIDKKESKEEKTDTKKESVEKEVKEASEDKTAK